MFNVIRGAVGAAQSATGDRGLVGSLLVTLLGAGMIGVGWAMSGPDFVPDILLQVGSSLVLVIPLVWLGWMIERRLARAEHRTASMLSELAGVRDAVARLDQVGTAARTLIESTRASWEDDLVTVADAPTQSNLVRLLDRATSDGLLAREGFRVRVPGTDLRLRFTPVSAAAGTVGPGVAGADPLLRLSLERADGELLHHLVWAAGTPAEVVARDIAEAAVALHVYPGDDEFDASGLLRDLLAGIRCGLQARHGDDPRRLGALIELPGRQWAIAEDGLYCLDRDYRVPLQRSGQTGEDWRTHMLAKPWVDRDDFLTAYGIATTLGHHRARQR